MRFPRAQRLTGGADLRRVQREGKHARTRHLSVRATASPQARMRVGLVVPRYHHTAVLRNRLKRRLREISRRELLPQELALDVVIRASEGAYGLNFEALRTEVLGLIRRVAGS